MKVFLISYVANSKHGAYLAFAENLNDALEVFRKQINYVSYEIKEVTPNILKHFVYKEQTNE